MRLFIVINFDQHTKRNLLAVQDRLRQLGEGRFTRPENLHLTLAFLGEVSPHRVAAVQGAMEQTAFAPFTLRFDHTGCFRREGGDIPWVGLAPNQSLQSLQSALCDRLRVAGFRLEERSFTPHITLAREMRFGDKRPKTLLESPFEAPVAAISLMCSQRVDGRLIYTEEFTVEGGQGR